jgi:hypothetical protein
MSPALEHNVFSRVSLSWLLDWSLIPYYDSKPYDKIHFEASGSREIIRGARQLVQNCQALMNLQGIYEGSSNH